MIIISQDPRTISAILSARFGLAYHAVTDQSTTRLPSGNMANKFEESPTNAIPTVIVMAKNKIALGVASFAPMGKIAITLAYNKKHHQNNAKTLTTTQKRKTIMPTNKRPIIIDLPAGTHYVCMCGQSKGLPYCDGSHEGTEHSPQAVTLDAADQVAMCTCKHTRTKPFCDGSHKTAR